MGGGRTLVWAVHGRYQRWYNSRKQRKMAKQLGVHDIEREDGFVRAKETRGATDESVIGSAVAEGRVPR